MCDEEVVQNDTHEEEDSIDIMEKFTRKNMCKLSYEAFGDKESLKEHEEAGKQCNITENGYYRIIEPFSLQII